MENPDEEEPRDYYTVPQNVHYHSHWKHNQDSVYWVQLSRAQDQGLQFWQTKSHAIIVHSLVPADCFYRVISQNGDRILFERHPTPRPAPKVTLKSNWHSQQHHEHKETCCGPNWDTRRQREATRRMIRLAQGELCGILKQLLTKTH